MTSGFHMRVHSHPLTHTYPTSPHFLGSGEKLNIRCMLVSVVLFRRDAMMSTVLTKESISLELAYSFRGLVHCHYGGKHGGVQTDMVLEK